MYISLHNRTAYSFGTALTTPVQLAAFAYEQHMPAIALTDLHGLYAAVEFQQECRGAGVKPIFGAEMTLVDGPTVTLLAQTLRGYGHLCRLISRHHVQGANTDDLCELATDVICIIGSQKRGRSSFSNKTPEKELRPLFCAFPSRLCVELAIHGPEDVPVARRRAAWADTMGIPVVATCESRCLKREQMLMLRALASIGTLTLLDRPHPDKPEGAWHLRPPAEMDHLFRRRPDALANTLRIAEQCNVTLDLDRDRFPAFTCPAEMGSPADLGKGDAALFPTKPPKKSCVPFSASAIEYLRELCVAGCRRRYVERPPQKGIGGRRPTLDEALQRLDRELAIIDQVHYAEYFLVFHEIVQHCRAQGIATLARGSAADSLVCYALGVSHACPFRFDLPFDRFLNAERAKFSKMADIDLDLPWDRRDEVIRWVYDRWGHDRVAMIGSPNTFHARAAIAELGKVFGLPPHEVHRITKRLPHTAVHNLPRYLANSPEARELPVSEEPYRTILGMAIALEGLPRHWAMHPCGLVVSPEPLTDLVPVQPSPKGPLVAQYDMDAIEALGFIKIDLLGQAGLSVLRDAVAELERTDGLCIDLERDVDYSDRPTWHLIASGNARGVHHIESPAMTSLLQQCGCGDIDCLTAIVAIIRPGAANQGKKDVFARRHAGLEAPTYAHPSLVPILEKTYGLMVFEEHILQIATGFAGLNLGQADVLRRALNKQNQAMILDMKAKFEDGARQLGRTPEEITAVWSQVEGFSGFMFNKAHSAEYAVEAFQGAWLKLRWPAHYLAAILSNYRGFYAHSPTLPQILYVMEALRLGIRFLPPCVNRSRPKFCVERDARGERDVCGERDANEPGTGWERRDHRARRDRREECEKERSEKEGCESEECESDANECPTLLRGEGDQGGCTNERLPQRLDFDRANGSIGTLRSDPDQAASAAFPEGLQASPSRAGGPALQHSSSPLDIPGARFNGLLPTALATGIARGAIPIAIRIPISHINGLSEAFLERYQAAREHGPFTSLENFVDRCHPSQAEALSLLDAGALDCMGRSRPELFWRLRRLLRHPQGSGLFCLEKGVTLTSSKQPEAGTEAPAKSKPDPLLPPVELTIPDTRQIARRETELLGFPVTLHPLDYLGGDDNGRQIDWSRYTPVAQLGNHPRQRVHVCGLMVADRVTGTFGPATAGGLMKFVTLADRSGFVETILFPDVYQRFGHLTAAHPILAATGIVEPFETGHGFTLRIQQVRPPAVK